MASSPKELLESFKKSRLNTPAVFIIVFVVDTVLLWMSANSWTDTCLIGILMGLFTIFGFTWLGVEEPKKILILITVMFVLLSPVFSFMHVEVVYDQEYPLQIPGNDSVISSVSVDPYIGNSEKQSFNFTAVVKGSASNISINLTVIDGLNGRVAAHAQMKKAAFNSTENTTLFYSNVVLDVGNYAFIMDPYYNDTGKKLASFYYPFRGPQNAEKSEMFVRAMPYSFAAIFLQIGGLSYILAGMYWWTRVARDKKREVITVRKEEGQTMKCPVCEHSIPDGTETCPYCGAEIQYEEAGTGETDETETDETPEIGEKPVDEMPAGSDENTAPGEKEEKEESLGME